MLEANRPHAEFARAMAAEKVLVGREWPVWPTKVRVTIGTQEDMNAFKKALERVSA